MGNPAPQGGGGPFMGDVQPQTEFQKYLLNARVAGQSWEQIHADMAQRIEKATAAGHTDDEIARSMDLNTDAYEQARANASIASTMTRNAYQTGGTIPDSASPLDYWQAGVKGTSGGEVANVLAGQDPGETQWTPSDHASLVNRTLYGAGQIIGSTPAFLAGAGIGILAAPETGGASLAGAFGFDAAMRKAYALHVQNGVIKDPIDFAARTGSIAMIGAENAGIGAMTEGAGSSVDNMLKQAGAKGLPAWLTKNAAEYIAMTAGQAYLARQLPSRQQLLDGAILLAMVHLGGAALSGGAKVTHGIVANSNGTVDPDKVSPVIRTTGDNLLEAFADHGISVPDNVRRALSDPVLRQGLQTPRDGPRHVPPGSSHTEPVYSHDRDSAPDLTVARPPADFDAATAQIFHEEGGKTIDTNGLEVNMGIDKASFPGVDVDHLTKQQAVKLYYDHFWTPMHIDSLPDNMKQPVYDAAIVEGVGKAKQMLAESGNDPVRFSELRMQHFRDLVERNPAKYGKYMKTWTARVQRTMGGVKLSDGVDLARELNNGEPVSSPEMDEWNQFDPDTPRGEPGFLSKFVESETGTLGQPREKGEPEETDFVSRVNSATADPKQPDGIVKTTSMWAHKLYLELFNPKDPLGRLVRDVRRGGGTIEDANNPLLLDRMAEASPNYVMKAIDPRGDMVNLKGDVIGPSMGKILEPFKNEDPKGLNFWGYYTARWSADAMGRGLKTPMKPQDALDYIKAGHDKYGKAFDQMVNLNNQSLHWLVDGGIISKERYDAAVASNQAYMPAQRVRPGVEPGAEPGGRKMFDPIFKAKGSELQVQNVQEAIIKNLFLRHSLASHNLAMQAVADAAEKHGFAIEAGKEMMGHNGGPPLNADQLPEDKLNPDLEARMTDLMGDHLKGQEVPIFRDGVMHKYVFHDPELSSMLRGMNSQQLTMWDTMVAFPAKVQRTSIVTMPAFPLHILEYDLVFQQLTKMGQNTIAQAYLGAKNVFGHTPLWDEWERKGAPDRVLDGYTKSKFVQDVLKDRSDPTIMDNVWNVAGWAPRQIWRGLRAWGMATSQIMPVGRYAMLRDKTSPENAAFQASEAPFHRSGFGGVVGKRLNSGMPFTTAWLNGLEKMSRAAIGHPRPGEERVGADGKPIEWDAKALGSFWAKGLGISAIVLSQMLMNHDKKWWQATPGYVKDNSLFIFHIGADWEETGDRDPDTGAPIYIPHGITIPWRLPPIASTLFGAIPRRLAEQFFYDNPHAWDNFLPDAAAGFAPPGAMIPSMLTPVIEQLTNHSIYGNHPIVPDAQRNLDAPEQYTPYTTTTAKLLAKGINFMLDTQQLGGGVAPAVVDNYIHEWGAGGVEEIVYQADQLMHAMGIDANHHEPPKWDDDPFVHSLAERYPGFSAEPIKAFDARYATYTHERGFLAQAIENDDFATFQRKIADNPELAALAAPHPSRDKQAPPDIEQFGQALNEADRQIDPNGPTMMWFETARAIKTLEKRYDITDSLPTSPSADDPNAPWMTPIEKRQQLDQIQATLMVMAERSNEWADKAGIK